MSQFDPEISQACERLLALARKKSVMIVTAESCTGGLIAAALTAIAGSSDVVERGFVTYSNQAKSDLLGVPAALIASHGAVSKEVARAMAQGAIAQGGAAQGGVTRSDAQLGLSVTGVAGPGGGTKDKPVGLVHLGAHFKGVTGHQCHLFAGDRDAVRRAAVLAALSMGLDALGTGR